MQNFRLLHVDGGLDRRGLFGAPAGAMPPISVEIAPESNNKNNPSWTSVIIGQNGVGKSRMLAGIVDIFDAVEGGKSKRRYKDASISRVVYQCSEMHCEIEVDESDQIKGKLNGDTCDLTDLPLPSKVIALTTTPFDKFRISRSISRMPGKRDIEVFERYTYLGLRDRTGRASPTAAIYRALEGLFEASQSTLDRKARVAGVFDFLGYKAHIEVEYNLGNANIHRLSKLAEGHHWEDVFQDESEATLNRNSYAARAYSMLKADESLFDEIRETSAMVLDRTRGRRSFNLSADFIRSSKDNELFDRIQVLRKMNLLRMRSAKVQRKDDGAILDLKLASSGELGIVTGFFGLASVIEEGSLIFIDEPEISLHPEWQTSYIDLLLKTFEGVKGCHFVLATHSPLILSDINPDNSTVVSLDPSYGETPTAGDLSGKSADYLLVNAFHVAGKHNLYLKQEIIKALRLAADGEAASEEFASIVNPMKKLFAPGDTSNPVATLITQLLEAGNMARDAR